MGEPVGVTAEHEIGPFESFEHKEADVWAVPQRQFKLE
jgi:hypothetical protein